MVEYGFPFVANERYLIGFVQHGIIRSGEYDKMEKIGRLPYNYEMKIAPVQPNLMEHPCSSLHKHHI